MRSRLRIWRWAEIGIRMPITGSPVISPRRPRVPRLPCTRTDAALDVGLALADAVRARARVGARADGLRGRLGERVGAQSDYLREGCSVHEDEATCDSQSQVVDQVSGGNLNAVRNGKTVDTDDGFRMAGPMRIA